MTLYARLRLRLFQRRHLLAYLQDPRPAPDDSAVNQARVLDMGAALLAFDFDYGNLLRWLGGAYTDAHRDWTQVFDDLSAAQDISPPVGYPPVDYERCFRVCTEGVPLQGHYVSDYPSLQLRNQAPLSPDLVNEMAVIDEKLRKEEQLSYHNILPRFLWRFIPGLFLSIFRVAYRWRDPKPRLCVDPSTTLSRKDRGNANAQIPDPGVSPDENPAVYYGTALMRYLQWVWDLRISYPREDILQMTDDISAAFHRVLYHPDMAVVFSSVWRHYLVIPVGTIFGARNGPSFYMEKGEMRSHVAANHPHPELLPDTELASEIVLPPEPTPDERAGFEQAVADSKFRGILRAHTDNPERRQPAFVDDSGNAHIRQHIRRCMNCSVASAYILFGFPNEDPTRPPCINPDKWTRHISHVMAFLGFEVDSRRMRLIWPAAKREKLSIFLDQLLHNQTGNKGPKSTPHEVSQVLGLVRHSAPATVLGTYRSLSLQFQLNDTLRNVPAKTQLRRWYSRRMISLAADTLRDLRKLRESITQDRFDPRWSRRIGLVIKRDPTIFLYTDASTVGLGGWSNSSSVAHMWRITVMQLFESLRRPAPTGQDNPQYWEPEIDPNKCHINILEFLAIIIDIWITVRLLFHGLDDPAVAAPRFPPGGHILMSRADNTSALSWLLYATRTRRPLVRRLAALLIAFLSHPLPAEFLAVQGTHIKGELNTGADVLSRFKPHPSWESVMEAHPPLQSLPVFPLPRKLLSLLAGVLTTTLTGDWCDEATTELWTLELPAFVTGSSRTANLHQTTSAPSDNRR